MIYTHNCWIWGLFPHFRPCWWKLQNTHFELVHLTFNSTFLPQRKMPTHWKTQTDRAIDQMVEPFWSTAVSHGGIWLHWKLPEKRIKNASSVTSSKFPKIMCNVPKRLTLQLELAAVINVSIHFFKATYDLEGGCIGPLVLSCYEITEGARMAV